jgi:uncharacterized protein
MSIILAEPGATLAVSAARLQRTPASPSVQLLTHGDEAETLKFLDGRPLHTVCLRGLILENGLVSPANRGAFYSYRDAAGQMEGVALIGHATLIEAHSDSALDAFAYLAQNNSRAHLIRGEQEMIERFWKFFTPGTCRTRLASREILLEQRESILLCEPVSNLRRATLADLELIIAVNAAMIFEECGFNPLLSDELGFRKRTARRIEQGRIWVWIDKGQLIFKTDVMAITPEVIYLEGVFVNQFERGKGYGLRCFSQLCEHLLQHANSLCLLVNEHNQTAINLYDKVGYRPQACYDTIYLQRESN